MQQVPEGKNSGKKLYRGYLWGFMYGDRVPAYQRPGNQNKAAERNCFCFTAQSRSIIVRSFGAKIFFDFRNSPITRRITMCSNSFGTFLQWIVFFTVLYTDSIQKRSAGSSAAVAVYPIFSRSALAILSSWYFPENAFVFMPDGQLGETLFGLTAEELELRKKPDVDITEIGSIK